VAEPVIDAVPVDKEILEYGLYMNNLLVGHEA
jgi:hypothetical protein